MTMKRFKLTTFLTLTLLMTCLTQAHAKKEVSGTVYTSLLKDYEEVKLTGDTKIVVNMDKILRYVDGDYNLTIEDMGGYTLGIDNRKGYATSNAIYVKSLTSSANLQIAAKGNCIRVTGDVTISNQLYAQSEDANGISADGDVNLSGTNIDIRTPSGGVLADGQILVNGQLHVQVSKDSSHALRAYGRIYMKDGFAQATGGVKSVESTVEVAAGTLIADAGSDHEGIYAKEGITLKGTITATGTIGISTPKDIVVDGTITATGKKSYAIYTEEGKFYMKDGLVQTTGGIRSEKSTVEMAAGTLVANAGSDHEGIYAYNDITLKGTITATGTNGIYAQNGNVEANGTLTATGTETYAIYSYLDCTLTGNNIDLTGQNFAVMAKKNLTIEGNLKARNKERKYAGTWYTQVLVAGRQFNDNYEYGDITLKGGDMEITAAKNCSGIMGGNITLEGNINVYADTDNQGDMGSFAVWTVHDIFIKIGSISMDGSVRYNGTLNLTDPMVIQSPEQYYLGEDDYGGAIYDSDKKKIARHVEFGTPPLSGMVILKTYTVTPGTAIGYTMNGMVYRLQQAGRTINTTWLKSRDTTTWAVIDGAEGSTYTPTVDDIGYFIRCVLTCPGIEGSIVSTGICEVVKQAVESIDVEVLHYVLPQGAGAWRPMAVEKEDDDTYYMQTGELYQITVKAYPEDADFEGILGKGFAVGFYERITRTRWGTFYTDWDRKTALESDKTYKTVYYVPDFSTNVRDASISSEGYGLQVAYNGDDPCMRTINLLVTDDGKWNGIPVEENKEVTVTKGETETGIPYEIKPSKASLDDLKAERREADDNDVAPVITFDNATRTMTVNAVNAKAGTYVYDIYSYTFDEAGVKLKYQITVTVQEKGDHLKGDVNEDRSVDISDIVAVINQIAGTATYRYADVNEDKSVDISDIVAIINIIAGQ